MAGDRLSTKPQLGCYSCYAACSIQTSTLDEREEEASFRTECCIVLYIIEGKNYNGKAKESLILI